MIWALSVIFPVTRVPCNNGCVPAFIRLHPGHVVVVRVDLNLHTAEKGLALALQGEIQAGGIGQFLFLAAICPRCPLSFVQ